MRAMQADVGFTGQNGATVASKQALHVPGCGPVPAVSLRKATTRRPSLRIKLRRHPDGGRLARFTVKLPKQVRVSRARVRQQAKAFASKTLVLSAVSVKGRTVSVKGLPKAGASTVTLRLDKGAVRLSSTARRKARRGKLKLSYKIAAVEVDGDRFSVRTSARAKR